MFYEQYIKKNIEKHLKSKIKSKLGISKFIEAPVDYKTFVESKEFLNFLPLSERQYMAFDFMFGKDPKKIFENINTIAVLEWGKGSGKDTIAALSFCYMVYILLCMESPQTYFGMPEGESIDFLNVATESGQAEEVFFDKLKQRILRSSWFKKRFNIRESGLTINNIYKSSEAKKLEKEIVITRDGVIFPKNIKLFSGNSAEASQEGKNLLGWVLDECAAFPETKTRSAYKLFKMLLSSSRTRFGDKFKGFLLSWPRYEGDFIETMKKRAEKKLHWYSDLAATWEVKPRKYFNKQTFKFEGYDIPIDFKEDFDDDPIDAKRRYLCIPPKSESPFIELSEKIYSSIVHGKLPLLETEDYLSDGKIKKKIIKVNHIETLNRRFVMTIDLAESHCNAGLSICHLEHKVARGPVLVQDLGLAWSPDPAKKIRIDLLNLKQFILDVLNIIPIEAVYFDRWNSAYLIQELREHVMAEAYSLYYDDYRIFKTWLYNDKIELLDIKLQMNELLKLRLVKGDKIEPGHNFTKDMVDTLVGALKVLGNVSVKAQAERQGTFIGTNLKDKGGIFFGNKLKKKF